MTSVSKTKVSFQSQPPVAVAWGLHDFPAGKLVIGIEPGGAVCRVSFAPTGKPDSVVKEWQKEWPKTVFTRDEKKTAAAAKSIGKSITPALLMTGTPFQQKVWKGLLEIPSGETVSYGTLAKRIKNPKAARAVGSACGKNPVLLVVPCHRVIANDGGLGGFSSGLGLKRVLLEAEGATAKPKRASGSKTRR